MAQSATCGGAVLTTPCRRTTPDSRQRCCLCAPSSLVAREHMARAATLSFPRLYRLLRRVWRFTCDHRITSLAAPVGETRAMESTCSVTRPAGGRARMRETSARPDLTHDVRRQRAHVDLARRRRESCALVDRLRLVQWRKSPEVVQRWDVPRAWRHHRGRLEG